MNKESSEEDALFDEALILLIQLQSTEDISAVDRLISEWRARSADHERSWQEVLEIHGMTGKILQDKQQVLQSPNMQSRRNFLLGGLAVSGVAASSFLVGPDLVLEARADHISGVAELKDIALADGSSLTLGPDSAVSVHMTSTERRIVLLKGMAFFGIVPSRNRPFFVEVGDLVVKTLEAAFEVSKEGADLATSVKQGTIEIQLPADAQQGDIVLADGEWGNYTGDELLFEKGLRDISQVATWREGLIYAEQETVSAVVGKIARWLPGRVVMLDTALGNQKISGVFDTQNPLDALRAVVHPYHGRVRQLSSYVTVISAF